MKRPAQFTLLLVLVALGLALGFYYWNRPSANVHRHQMLSTWGLGQHLAQQFPGSRIMVVSNPFVRQKDVDPSIADQEESRIEGLFKGLEPRIKRGPVVYPDLKPGALENPRALLSGFQTTTPVSLLVTSSAFDDLLAQHPESDIVVSLVGVPEDLAASEAWKQNGPPRFAFLFPDLQFLGGPNNVREAVLSGKLAAFVFIKPGVPTDDARVGRLNQKEFDQRFLVVHEGNIDQIMADWPGLFGQ